MRNKQALKVIVNCGGGTFGRLLKRGVAYGAMFPGYVNTIRQANEFTGQTCTVLFAIYASYL